MFISFDFFGIGNPILLAPFHHLMLENHQRSVLSVIVLYLTHI